MTLQSPRPFTEFVGFDANNDGNPVTDRVGDSGRNTYEGDYLRAWDIRLSRTIHISRERFQLQLIADSFNALNRPNVDEVFSVYGTYDFCSGQVPKHYKDSVSVAMQSFAGGLSARRAPSSEQPFRHSANDVQPATVSAGGEVLVLISTDGDAAGMTGQVRKPAPIPH